jgi:methylmalonyl-CoA/ethylmalonyl-CoA epimerase
MPDIDHIGICVHDLDAALVAWRDGLGFRIDGVHPLPERGLRVAFLDAGASRVELLASTGPDSEIAGFLARRGEGMHHVAFRVADLDAALDAAQAAGMTPLAGAGRPGAHGGRVAFLHPRSANGVLVELVEAPRQAGEGEGARDA